MRRRVDPVGAVRRRLPHSIMGWVQAGLLVVPVLVVAGTVWTHRLMVEDAFIYQRVAENVAHGAGPVFNAGERVEATTSMIWTFSAGLLRLVFGDSIDPGLQLVLLGWICTTAAVAFGMAGAFRLHRPIARHGVCVPAGALVVAFLTPFWYWGTSGLETGLLFLWPAVIFWRLAKGTDSPSSSRARWLLVVIGVGWFVRPEYLLLTVVFAGAYFLTLERGVGWRRRLISASFVVVPLAAGEVFRMGYYASLIPNTALAKSAGRTDLEAGWQHLRDAIVPYQAQLLLPATVFAAMACLIVGRVVEGKVATRRLIVGIAPIVGGVLLLSYAVRVGGDYQHARFAVPGIFVALLSSAVLPLPFPRRNASAVAFAVTTASTIGLAFWLAGSAFARGPFTADLAEVRANYQQDYRAQVANPIALSDMRILKLDDEVLQTARRGGDVLIDTGFVPIPSGERFEARPLPPGSGTAVMLCCVGTAGAALGTDVYIYDQSSLADPIGSRLVVAPAFDISPYGKLLHPDWVLSRYPETPNESASVKAARRAMACGDLRELAEATSDRLTIGRFLGNVFAAPRLTTLEVPSPTDSEAKFCSGQ